MHSSPIGVVVRYQANKLEVTNDDPSTWGGGLSFTLTHPQTTQIQMLFSSRNAKMLQFHYPCLQLCTTSVSFRCLAQAAETATSQSCENRVRAFKSQNHSIGGEVGVAGTPGMAGMALTI